MTEIYETAETSEVQKDLRGMDMKEQVNILIVDDLKENHLVMEGVLIDPELNIVKAMSGEEALSLCLSHDFAVIFMDVQMPGMDGFETAELLRGIEKTKNIPIIFVTALSKEKASVFKGYEVGAVDYLSKPIDPLILRSKASIFKDMYKQRRLIEYQAAELEDKVRELSRMQGEKEALESISMEDSLTKVYNRRGVNKLMLNHWKNCIRYNLPFSVMMFDLDRFKNYNDNYGHIKGDDILFAVAKASKEALFRAEDFVGRFGGEEFLVVMPNTPLEGAISVTERIFEAIEDLNLKHEFNGEFDRITISAGVATAFPGKDQNVKTIISEADEAMYIAKNNGRNQYRQKVVL